MAKALRLVLGIMVVGLLLAPTVNAAVHKGDILLGPSAQVAVPTGDFGDVAKVGFGFGAIGDYLVTDNVGIGADIIYNFFGSKITDAEAEAAGVSIDGPKVLQIGGHAKMFFSPEAETNPFAFIGLGIYSVKQTVSAFGFSASASSSEFGFNGGGGAQFRAGEKMRVAAQGQVHIIMSDPSSMYFGAALSLLFGVGGSH